jgi:hypothetical protein
MPVKASDIRARRADPPAAPVDRQEAPRERVLRRRPAGGGGGPRWRGCIPGGVVAVVLVALIPVLAVALVLLSFLGTFFGARGLPVPLLRPSALWAALLAAPWGVLLAALVQGGLAVAQYGGRQLARDDRRWWILYGLALAVSAWWNWKGYGPILIGAGVPWLLAAIMVVLGDVFPELALIRE